VGKNIYEANDETRNFFYAPLKDLLAVKWTIFSFFQLFLIRLVPDKYPIPKNTLKPTVLELDMSHGCSLGCVYCSVNSNSQNKKLRISFDLAKIAIDRVMQTSIEEKESFAIVFIGKGEPTLNWHVLVECVEYIKTRKEKLGIEGKTIIVTNGVISSEKAKWLARNINHIALSWDGNADVQNEQRPLANGGKSFLIVERTASVFRDENAYFEIRATWTALNVDRMVECTRMFIQYHPFELNYQPLLMVGRAINPRTQRPPIDVFVANFIESRKIARKAEIDVMMPSVETQRLNRKFCHAYEGTGFHLSAEGYITACECIFNNEDKPGGDLLTYGKVIDGKIDVDNKKIGFLRSIMVDKIPSCVHCFARWHCAGGCINTHLHYSNDPLSPRNHPDCEITKRIIFETLFQKLEQNLPRERR